jgi:hypothetical protein
MLFHERRSRIELERKLEALQQDNSEKNEKVDKGNSPLD